MSTITGGSRLYLKPPDGISSNRRHLKAHTLPVVETPTQIWMFGQSPADCPMLLNTVSHVLSAGYYHWVRQLTEFP